ncbi:NUDIX hydrolase [Thermomonospora cellulosilytica]|uniref:8-oxo-dGTP pyrophosphatase MutT (NUDIX family) n=1 Tax=Thermomonospora cellulosilytica TaxID=1411118 RepID=A0A7W3RBX8_9ACTN|nr:NUDIX hydrolase [Thermomonospora cellulosilytica]MBA9007259.1 8-oxo-dGTP pyrophosphatase MutT (NUDIX family) [Thermomonospora cellulosilytica]
MTNPEPEPAGRTQWVVHGERIVDENRHIRLSVADVELPNGVRFEQYVIRLPRCAMTLVLDDAGERILLIWRHRFILDRWDWEIPGGYVDPDEDGPIAAAREVEEETGWRPRNVEFLLTYQPAVGSADAPQDLYVAHGADLVGEPEPDEAEMVRWVPIEEAQAMIARGEIVGAATVMGVLHAVAARATARPRTPEAR